MDHVAAPTPKHLLPCRTLCEGRKYCLERLICNTAARTTIRTMINVIPEEWKALLNNGSEQSFQARATPRQEFFIKTKQFMLLKTINFIKAYRILLDNRLRNIDFSSRTEDPLYVFNQRINLIVSSEQL